MYQTDDSQSSPNIIRVIKLRRMRRAGHVARMGERTGTYRVLVRRSEGKRTLGIHRLSWEDNMVARRGQIRKIGWVIKTLEAQIGHFLLRCMYPESWGIVVQQKDPLGG